MPTQPIDQFLTDAQVALENARADSGLQAGLALVGYDAKKLQEGRALLERLQALHATQRVEYGDQVAATAAYNEAFAAAHPVYMRHLTLARVAFKTDAAAAVALDLEGRRKKSHSGWLVQARQFYHNLLANPSWMAAMAALGQSAAVLRNGQALVEAVAATESRQEQEKGDAQRSTQNRDAALDALDDWMGDFRTVARVAFAADPQQLEKLRIVVRA